jgi:hypothetical protein
MKRTLLIFLILSLLTAIPLRNIHDNNNGYSNPDKSIKGNMASKYMMHLICCKMWPGYHISNIQNIAPWRAEI